MKKDSIEGLPDSGEHRGHGFLPKVTLRSFFSVVMQSQALEDLYHTFFSARV